MHCRENSAKPAYRWFRKKKKQQFAVLLVCLAAAILCACAAYRELPVGLTWEAVSSPNGLHNVETAVFRDTGSDVCFDDKWYDRDSMKLDYSPGVDDAGNVAFIEWDGSNSKYSVVLNGRSLYVSERPCQELVVLEGAIVFFEVDARNNLTTIRIYSTNSGVEQYAIELPNALVLQVKRGLDGRMAFFTTVAYQNDCPSYSVYKIGINGELAALSIGGDRAPLLSDCSSQEEVTVDYVDMGDNESALLNAWLCYYGEQQTNPFSASNDYLGRLSWNESARLRGMVRLYEVTGDDDVALELQNCASRMLMTRNAELGISGEFNPPLLWASRRYSIGNEPTTILVNNASILESLLKIVNSGALADATNGSLVSRQIIESAESAWDYYEQF